VIFELNAFESLRRTTMTKLRFVITSLSVVFVLMAMSAIASAQATRTWVSGVGDDANPCSRTAPCKTFAGAISKTFIGGEIDALDPGGFGTVTVTKSITLDGCCITSILASGTTGVIINIPVGANDPERRVTIRHITINGTGSSGAVGQRTGVRAINFLSGNSLFVENCFIQNFVNEGIRAQLTAAGGYVGVKDTTITNCNVGIDIGTTTGVIEGMFESTKIERMTSNGINIGTHVFASVTNSQVFFNATDGISLSASANDGRVTADNSIISNNPGVGFRCGNAPANPASPQCIISRSTFVSNGTAFATAGGSIGSHGNNSVDGTIGVTPNGLGQQ
jgi:hypothetical protein